MQSNGMDSCSASHVEHIDVPHAHVFMFFNFSMYLLIKHTVYYILQMHYQDTRTMDRPFLMLRTRCVQERNLCVISHRGRHGAEGQHKSFHNRRLKIDRTFTQHQQ